jgi:hypothetical protein
MAFEHIPLDRPPEIRRTAARRSASGWVILVAGVVIAGALLTFWWMGRAQPPPVRIAPTAATDAARPPTRPRRQQMELPPLAQSDGLLRDLVLAVSRHPLLARFVAGREGVRAVTLAVLQIGDGRTPAQPLAALRPSQRVSIVGGAVGRVDPTSYARWNSAVRALLSIDAADAAQVYVNLKPLLDEAYRELGYPSGDFDDAMVRAMQMLMATPELKEDPVLLARPSYFEHQDPALRDLPPVQKQLILAGPDHRRDILGWLRQFARALELKIDPGVLF